jgi:hypothetical protein
VAGDDVNDFVVSVEDVEEFSGLFVPDEEVATVAAADDVFVVEAEEVYVFDGFDVGYEGLLASS